MASTHQKQPAPKVAVAESGLVILLFVVVLVMLLDFDLVFPHATRVPAVNSATNIMALFIDLIDK